MSSELERAKAYLSSHTTPLQETMVTNVLDPFKEGVGKTRVLQIYPKGDMIDDNTLDNEDDRITYVWDEPTEGLPFSTGSMQLVFGVNAFSNFNTIPQQLSEIGRVLKHEGVFIHFQIDIPDIPSAANYLESSYTSQRVLPWFDEGKFYGFMLVDQKTLSIKSARLKLQPKKAVSNFLSNPAQSYESILFPTLRSAEELEFLTAAIDKMHFKEADYVSIQEMYRQRISDRQLLGLTGMDLIDVDYYRAGKSVPLDPNVKKRLNPKLNAIQSDAGLLSFGHISHGEEGMLSVNAGMYVVLAYKK